MPQVGRTPGTAEATAAALHAKEVVPGPEDTPVTVAQVAPMVPLAALALAAVVVVAGLPMGDLSVPVVVALDFTDKEVAVQAEQVLPIPHLTILPAAAAAGLVVAAAADRFLTSVLVANTPEVGAIMAAAAGPMAATQLALAMRALFASYGPEAHGYSPQLMLELHK